MIRRFLLFGIFFGIAPGVCSAQSAPAVKKLMLPEAEDIALKNNPAISVARLSALSSQQITRGVRSAYFPSSSINLTGVDALDNSRITAGGLNNPIIYPRVAEGLLSVNWLPTSGEPRISSRVPSLEPWPMMKARGQPWRKSNWPSIKRFTPCFRAARS